MTTRNGSSRRWPRYPAQRPAHIAVYLFCRSLVLVVFTLLYRMRAIGTRKVPEHGPVIFIANHQAHLDPPLIGCAIRFRPVHFIARVGLFKNRAFGWLIRALNAIPIRQGESDIAAIRTSLARLEQGAAVVVFAEGARTHDGAMTDFQRGAWLLMRKAHHAAKAEGHTVAIVPVAVEGPYDVWPRRRTLPKLRGRIMASFGEPIDAGALIDLGEDRALAQLHDTVDALRLDLRRKLRRASKGRTPEPGPGDAPASAAARDASPGVTAAAT